MYRKILRNSFPYIVIAGVAFYMFRGIFAPGFMSGPDNSFHYYDAYYLTNTLIPQYHWINGWSMQSMAGMPIFVDYYQTGFLTIAFLNKILSIPLNFSYKAMVLFSYILLGAGFYKLSSYRFGKAASFLISICLMLQKEIYHDRILAGIWNEYLSIGLLFIFLHMLDKHIEDMTVKKALTLGLMLGLLILTHLYVATFAFIILFLYIFPYLKNAVNRKKLIFKQFVMYSCMPIVAFLLSSYYLYGFIITRDYLSGKPTKGYVEDFAWGIKAFFGPLENNFSVSGFFINLPIVIRTIFVFFGIYILLKKEKDLKIKHFLGSLIAFIFVASLLFTGIFANLFSWWKHIPLVATLQANRFLIYIQIGLYVLAAYGISKFLGYFRKKHLLLIACTIPILISVFFHYTHFARDASRTLNGSRNMPDVFKVWRWVDENVSPEEERIVYQNTFGNMDDAILRRSDVFALSGIFTDVAQIGVSRPASPFPQEKYMRNDQGCIFGKKIDKVSAGFIADTMQYFNARYIVSVEPNLKSKLSKSHLFLEEEEFGNFTIFRLEDFKTGWISFKEDAEYRTIAFENQRLVFDIQNKTINNQAFIKVAYHPFWQALLNEKPGTIEQDRYGLMKISLPEKGFYRLGLTFDSFNPLWVIVSISSLLMTSLFILKLIGKEI